VRWNLSCPDWEQRLVDGEPLVPPLPLNLVEAARAEAIFNKLRLHDVTGTPTNAEAGGDWFRLIVRALFGSLDPATKARIIRELFLLVPKKNAKTTNGALLMLTALLLNERPHAPFVLTAPVNDTANMAFESISGAIALDDVLAKKLHVRDHLKTIVHRETKAELEIMTFDPAVLTGRKFAGTLIDELHVVSKMSKAASAIRQIRGGMLPYPEAFLAFITTQSEEQPAGVFKAELKKARAIRDGEQEGVMLPVLYEFPMHMQQQPAVWRDPANWHLVTPNAGRSLTIERLVEEMEEAEQKGDEELRAWASQHLNVEIGVALKSNGWVGADHWEACATPGLTLEEVLRRSEVVVCGVDGGGLDDLLGFNILGRCEETKDWLSWSHAWAHRCVLKRRQEIAPRLLDFETAGNLTFIDDDSDEDVEQVADYVEKCEDSGLLDNIGVDQAGIGAIVEAIVSRKIAFERIVGIPQGWKLVSAIKTAERRLAARTLRHAPTEMMNWSLGNAKVEPRGNAIVITKQAAGSAKIDPLMALLDSVALMSMNPQPRKKKFQLFFA
jgi:phage terminase large subunit-like protein